MPVSSRKNQNISDLPQRATLKDVAERAGVTKAMVSLILSGKRRASPQTLKAVTRAIEELGYVPNPHAQRLATGGCDKTVAVLWSIDLGVSTEQSWFIHHRLDEAGFDVDFYSMPAYISNVAAKQLQVVSRICHQKPRAIICSDNYLEGPALAHLKRYVQNGGIVILYSKKHHKGFDNIVFHGFDNVYQAAHHLLDLGHRKIGLSIHGFLDKGNLNTIKFQQALSERGVKMREKWLWGFYPYEEAGAHLAEAFLKLKQRPTAMCIINDVVASAFVAQLYRAGVSVPHDVSVVGYDDTRAARFGIVPLTTVSHPVEGTMRPLMEMLFSRLDGSYSGPARLVNVRGELIIRESTAPPAK